MASIIESLDQIKAKSLSISPGDWEHTVFIIHGNGARYPISQYVTNINLFEDISSTSITGWLEVRDPTNLLQSGPLNGEELLELKFETPGGSDLENFTIDFTKNPLYIHSVQNVTYTQDFNLVYRIHFCSPELMHNNRIRVSQSYTGKNSDIVKTILEKIIGTAKKLTIEDTLTNRHWVVPNLRPFDFLNHLATSSQASPKLSPAWIPKTAAKSLEAEQVFKGSRSDFLFYEGVDGYNFSPISTPDFDSGLEFTLSLQPTTTGSHKDRGGDGAGTTGYTNQMLRATRHTLIDEGDKLAGTRNGTWAGTHIRHNGVTKSFKVYKSNYLNALKEKKYSQVSETPTFDPRHIIETKNITEWEKGHTRFSSSSSMADIGISKDNGHVFYPSQTTTPELSLQRQMQIGHLLRGQKLHISLPGNSGLRVGMGAFADMPPVGLAAKQPGLKGSKLLGEDRLRNYWIITKIAHVIKTTGTDSGYNCNIELANTMSMTEDVLKAYNDMWT